LDISKAHLDAFPSRDSGERRFPNDAGGHRRFLSWIGDGDEWVVYGAMPQPKSLTGPGRDLDLLVNMIRDQEN